MARPTLRNLRFRANPAYELMPFDRLSAAEQRVLKGLRDDPQCYGILRPHSDSRLTIKSVTTDVALLLLTLQSVARLPECIVDAFGEQWDSFVSAMVLDELLQVDVNGEMLCGPAAVDIVEGEKNSTDSERFIATLSRRALEYAETLDIISVPELSGRLYSYNGLPASVRWRRLLCDRRSVESYLAINSRTLADILDADWIRLPDRIATGWIAWQSKRLAPKFSSQTYKLYVSPTCAVVGSVLGSVVEAASRFGASHWKVGGDVRGLLRSDKLILYFEYLTDLQNAAAHLRERLKGCPSQGVPFTGELEDQGLLSWGIDPPAERNSVPWLRHESWRARICNRLASALLLAKRAPICGTAPSRFAMLRLRLDGIDTDTWTPAP